SKFTIPSGQDAIKGYIERLNKIREIKGRSRIQISPENETFPQHFNREEEDIFYLFTFINLDIFIFATNNDTYKTPDFTNADIHISSKTVFGSESWENKRSSDRVSAFYEKNDDIDVYFSQLGIEWSLINSRIASLLDLQGARLYVKWSAPNGESKIEIMPK